MPLYHPQIWPNSCSLRTRSAAPDTTSIPVGQSGAGLQTPNPVPDSFQMCLQQALQFTAAVSIQHSRLGTCSQEPLEHVTHQGGASSSGLQLGQPHRWGNAGTAERQTPCTKGRS